ncbi:DUF3854 domain-containing protein, partial [Candidatus Nephthysia bennettiae]|nr:DUF3854 domain-containing protein [Candidatus Dormibacteraeota bacterium]
MTLASVNWTAEEYRERTGRLLLAQHHEQLLASAISLEVASGRGYWSATLRRELRDLGFSARQQEVVRDASRSQNPTAALVVPLWWTDTELPVLHQVRPDEPRRDSSGHVLKYETPRDAGVKLDVHPSMRQALGAPDVPLLVTEGAKKVDAAATGGLCCVGLLGVDSWRGRNAQGGVTALAEWNDVHLRGRSVLLCFDSDVMAKSAVYMALLRLRTYLESKGADTLVVYLPSGPLGAKVGLDDYLAEGRGRDDLLALATKEIRHPDETKPGSPAWVIEEYRVTREGIWRRGREDDERRLSDFSAYIERKDIDDDGDHSQQRDAQELLESQRYHLVIQQGDRPLARHAVTASSFHSMRWPAEIASLDLIVAAGSSIRDYLREAIELVSREAARRQGHTLIPRRTVFVHTGWRLVGGKHVYLHAGGAIGAEGPVAEVEVRLDSHLHHFELPEPPEGSQLAEAVEASLRLLELGPDEVMIPVLGAVYRSVLGPADFALHSTGDSGRFKTEVAALAQQHFGAAMDARNLPLSWTSTGNSIEGVLHTCKDALAVADDFLPAGLPYVERERMLQAAARVFRAQGNRAGRSRMRADTSLRAPKVPRGLLYSTGEEIPPGLSQVARVWVLEQAKDAISSQRLTTAQEASDLYPRALAGYLRWLAPRMKTMASSLRTEVAALRAVHQAAHRRTSDIAANLEIGWARFLQFASESGAIAEERRQELIGRVRTALLCGAVAQARHQSELSPVERYLSGLQSTIASGAVHVTTLEDGPPDDPGAWGWRKRTVGVGADREERWEPRGDRVGWLSGQDLYLLPEGAYKAAAALYRDGLGLGETALRKRLHEAGVLASVSVEKDEVRLAVRAPRAIGGRPRVLHLLSSFSPGPPGPAGPAAPDGTQPSSDPTRSAFPDGPATKSSPGPDGPVERDQDGPPASSGSRPPGTAQAPGPDGPDGPDGPGGPGGPGGFTRRESRA